MQVVNGFWDMLHQYMGGNILYLFAALAWILFLYQLKKQERRVALLAALLLFAAVFNPLSYRILITVTGQVKTYYRFLWIIPWETAIAYLLYEGMQRMDNLRHRLLLVCGICLGLLCMNTSREQWRLPENSYQLSYDILEVAEHLKSLRTEAGRDRITILADTNICHAIREYDASICFPFESYHISGPEGVKGNVPAVMTMLMNNQDYYDPPMITETLDSNHVDYVVININNDISLSYMQRLHWQIVATTSSYHILQYQEPVFTPEPLSAAGLEIEEVEVVIPGLTEEYHFLFLADLHIITTNEEIPLDDPENVLARQGWSSVSEEVTAAQYWGSLPDILDSCNADGILLGGDMLDFCSPSNVACLKQGLDRLLTPWLYVRADHDVKPYWCQGITQEECDSFHSEIDGDSEVWCLELPELCVAGPRPCLGDGLYLSSG